MSQLRYCLVLISLLVASVSQAKLSLSTLIMHFEPNQPSVQEVMVENTSKEVMYITIEPFLIEAPNTPNEKRIKIDNPRDLGLVLSAIKLTLPAQSKMPLRIRNLKKNLSEDRVYRLTFTPTVNGVSAEGVALKTIIAYDMLVVVQPKNPKPDLVASRQGDSIEFTNQGNTNVLLRQGKQCADETLCADLPATRLYAGNSWSVALPHKDKPVQYIMGVGSQNLIQNF